jgi:hypothetical protein
MEQKLEELGTIHDRKFAAEERATREGLMSDASTEFERAHEHLGLLLGYDAGNRETPGALDPWWLVDSSLCFIFEDHSEASEDSTLSVKKARQVASHRAWARAELPVDEDAEILPILVTPVLTPDSDAIPHVAEVYLWPIADFRTWASDALGIVRELRVAFPGAGDLAWRSQAADRYVEHLGPDAIKARLIRGADWAARNW